MIGSFRRAVTLIEVIFAIGVILIGMVGLLAVLPLAGSRARSSVALNTGTAVADAAFDRLVAGGYLRSERLFRADGVTLDYTQSICVDPVQVISATSPAGNRYSATLFPHYQLNHHPLTDPSNGASANWPVAQPRLFRVGMQHAGSGRVFNLEEALKLTESHDDVPAERPKDRTLNAYLRGYPAVASGLSYGKRLQTGEYSWIATLNPQSSQTSERYGLLSVVVFRNRDRGFDFPAATATTPERNANRERLALVTEARGFRGGAGGVVALASSANTTSNLTANHWIMLSRITPSGPIHRWYRVAGTDGDPVMATAGDLGLDQLVDAGESLWQRRVLLDGSDWTFDTNLTNHAAKTFATIADSVVSVTERLVRIR